MTPPNSRREFLKVTTAVGAGVYVGGSTAFAQEKSPNAKIRYACIGVGGKGESDSSDAANHGEVVAICDVDKNTLKKRAADERFENATQFSDYREMFEKMGDKIDAVTISTPDHTHALAAVLALKSKKAVFCQKPLTHSVYEARLLADLAREYNVPTVMGNQGTAEAGLRKAAALLKSGQLGAIKEVHVVTNRPVWPQGGDRPAPDEVPANLNWDLWLGGAPDRPYAKGYHPFAWRGWWDFGTGALGDMACHTFNMPFAGVGLKNPSSLQAWCTGHNKDSYPQKSKIKFEFPAADGRGPVSVWWYDGGNKADESLLLGLKAKEGASSKFRHDSGAIIVCENATLYSPGDYAAEFMILTKDGEQPIPDVEFERSPGHFTEFHESIIGKRARAMGNFETYSGPLTETILLGNLAVYAAASGESKVIEWDAKKLEAVNAPEVAHVVKRAYRKGWEV